MEKIQEQDQNRVNGESPQLWLRMEVASFSGIFAGKVYVAFTSNVSGMVHGKDFSLWESEKRLNGKDFHATPSHQKEGWPKGCLSLSTSSITGQIEGNTAQSRALTCLLNE